MVKPREAQKVFIISPSFEEQKILEQACVEFSAGALEPQTTASFGQESDFWLSGQVDLLVLKLPEDDTLQSFFVKKLKQDVPKALPMIFISDSITAAIMQLSTEFSRVRILKAPVSGFDFFRAAIDLTNEYHQVQSHPRFEVSQLVSVSSDTKGGTVAATLKNISISGAYLESKSDLPFPFESGECVKILARLGNPQREIFFDGKIVWKRQSVEGLVGCGIQFVDGEKTMEKLLTEE